MAGWPRKMNIGDWNRFNLYTHYIHRKYVRKKLEQITTEQNFESPASLVLVLKIDKYSTY